MESALQDECLSGRARPTRRARGRLDSHRFLAFSLHWILSVSWASLVPPAAGNASRWADYLGNTSGKLARK